MKRFVFVFFICIIHLPAFAQSETDSTLVNYYKKIVRTLSADSFGGRPASSKYELKAANFINGELKQLSLSSKFHLFKYQPQDTSHMLLSRNVYCFINHHADQTIIIGAHYDHIGMGGPLSMNMGKQGIHNGADDNASGIALMLGLAKNLKSWDLSQYNLVLVAYSAHEIGLFGSEKFSAFAFKKWPGIGMVINFDMVGRMNNDLRWVKIYGKQNLGKQGDFFDAEYPGLKFRIEQDSVLNQLDSRSFYQKKIPCLSISTGVHDDYHKMTDDESKINYLGILWVQKLVESFLIQYQNQYKGN